MLLRTVAVACFFGLAGGGDWAINKCVGEDGRVSFQDAPGRVTSFQNLRFVFYSCLRLLRKACRMFWMQTKTHSLECAFVCPDTLGVGVAEIPISMTVGRLRLVLCARHFAPAFLAIAGSSYPARDVESVSVHQSC